jgi:hypothetical protein
MLNERVLGTAALSFIVKEGSGPGLRMALL